MINTPKTSVETAQTLLKAIGRNSLLAYFTERLEAGKDLPSRPHIITAYVQLVGIDAWPLLAQAVQDEAETSATRIAAIKALGNLIEKEPLDSKRSEIINLVMHLLHDADSKVRNSAAMVLASLQVT